MKSASILIVDDSGADRTSLRLAFERSGMPLKLSFAESGRSALALLMPKSVSSRLRPDLILLDVKMPGMSGLDLLHAIKADPALMTIPVFMLSGSDDKSDVLQAYSSSASGFIVKPSEVSGLNECANVIARLATCVLTYAER
jgi:CheY-like chemotaxis protein